MTAQPARRLPAGTILAVTLGPLALGWWWLVATTSDALVVYCAHDLIYAEEVLRNFERQTGIRVVIVGDTEATKSLGLVQRLIRERDDPVCDVFWNNQLLGTVELARQGVLEPYKGTHWDDVPQQFRDDDGLWTGFGGRLRVWIYDTESPPELSLSFDVEDYDREWTHLAIAEPMFGTTLSHYAILWEQLGERAFKDWHHEIVDAGVRFVAGNATVKDLVAGGVCRLGMTDSDDFFQAVDAGQSVAMSPIFTPDGQRICIPNTVAIIRGTEKRAQAQQFVDYLTSAESELRMARSKSRQIPLSTNVSREEVPEDVQPMMDGVANSVDLKPLAEARSACLAWLSEEFAP